MNHPFFNFLAEFFTRLFSGKPKFFASLQTIAFITAGVSSGILYLKSISTDLPDWLSILGNLNLVVGAVVAIIMSQLPNKS
jgi:hypothetical protein